MLNAFYGKQNEKTGERLGGLQSRWRCCYWKNGSNKWSQKERYELGKIPIPLDNVSLASLPTHSPFVPYCTQNPFTVDRLVFSYLVKNIFKIKFFFKLVFN